jgi:hypothetical protein
MDDRYTGSSDGQPEDSQGGPKHALENAKNGAEEQIRSLADRGKEQVATRLESVARAIESVRDSLGDDEPGVRRYIDTASARVMHASRYLRDHDSADLVREIQNVARSQPLLVLGGSAALGFFVGRMLRAGGSTLRSRSVSSGGDVGASSPIEGGYGSAGGYGTSGGPTSGGSSSMGGPGSPSMGGVGSPPGGAPTGSSSMGSSSPDPEESRPSFGAMPDALAPRTTGAVVPQSSYEARGFGTRR